MTEKWFLQSMVATILIVPVWLITGFFEHNLKVKSDVFLIWYFFSVAAVGAATKWPHVITIFPSWRLVAIIVATGIIFGGIANIYLFQAVTNSPNPGLPLAIVNIASAGVFLSSALLSRLIPKYFDRVEITPTSLLGVALTIVGTFLIAIRR